MDSSDNMVNHPMEALSLTDSQAAEGFPGQGDSRPVDMLRIRQQMSNQCFEMAAQLQAGKNKRSCSTSEAERDLPDYVNDLENAKTNNFIRTLMLHRMQIWHAIEEKLKHQDTEADELKAMSDRYLSLCSRVKAVQKESRTLEDEITEIQKERLDLKRLTQEKMKLMEELMSKKDQPDDSDTEKYRATLEKGQANLEKYKKMVLMTQNVFRGILLAFKINWLNDPRLRDIVMTLEELPFAD